MLLRLRFNVVDIRTSYESFVNNEYVQFFVLTVSPWATLRSVVIYGNTTIHGFAHNYGKPYTLALTVSAAEVY
jgi:hypothetical protein